MTPQEKAALERLFRIVESDTRQSGRVADFLLAWWNARDCGGFDLTSMWDCEDAIVEDMVIVFRMIGRNQEYPDQIGYRSTFKAILRHWRPERVDG